MEKLHLLIADDTPEVTSELPALLKDDYFVACCSDGKQAIEYIKEKKVDILLLDMMLPGLDGLSLIDQIHLMGIYPKILAVSSFYSQYVITSLQECGVSYLIRKPCESSVMAGRIVDITKYCFSDEKRMTDPGEALQRILSSLGIPNRYRGYAYLTEAIMICCSHPNIPLTKELYPMIADRFGGNWEQVERAIRSVISKGWDKRNPAAWNGYFPPEIAFGEKVPSNGRVISEISSYLERCSQVSKRKKETEKECNAIVLG